LPRLGRWSSSAQPGIWEGHNGTFSAASNLTKLTTSGQVRPVRMSW